MADKKFLTDRYLRSLRPALPGQRPEVWDTSVPGFGIRNSDIENYAWARRGKAAVSPSSCKQGSHLVRDRAGAQSASMAMALGQRHLKKRGAPPASGAR